VTKHERYNRSAKGKARYQRYRKSVKGHANERRVDLRHTVRRREALIQRTEGELS